MLARFHEVAVGEVIWLIRNRRGTSLGVGGREGGARPVEGTAGVGGAGGLGEAPPTGSAAPPPARPRASTAEEEHKEEHAADGRAGRGEPG